MDVVETEAAEVALEADFGDAEAVDVVVRQREINQPDRLDNL